MDIEKISKVLAVINFIAGIFYVFVFLTAAAAGIAINYGINLIEDYGAEAPTELPLLSIIMSLLISGFGAALYFASGYGFLKMKTWQPIVFFAVTALSLSDMIYNAYVVGFQDPRLLISLVFFFIWIGLLYVVWKNKEKFKN